MAVAVARDPAQAATVAVASAYQDSGGVEPNKSGGLTAFAVGSSCAGRSGWVQRDQVLTNVWGQMLISARLKTTFCYNGRSVSDSGSSTTYSISAIASAGGWGLTGWSEFSEGFYAYNNHMNGGVKTVGQADFQECVLKIGCFGTAGLVLRTYAHYDGSWTASGATNGGQGADDDAGSRGTCTSRVSAGAGSRRGGTAEPGAWRGHRRHCCLMGPG